MSRILGIATIWGAQTLRPIINVPADALMFRLRLRSEKIAIAFVRFSNRVEQWIILPADEQTLGCPQWKLGILQAINFSHALTPAARVSEEAQKAAPETNKPDL